MIDSLKPVARSNVYFADEELQTATPQNPSEGLSRVLMAKRAVPDWLPGIINRLDSCRGLSANWDSYGACRPSLESIELGKVFLQLLASVVGVDAPDISITAMGNAAFFWEFGQGQRNLDVEITPRGSINFAFIDEGNEMLSRAGRTQDPAVIASLLTQW